MVLPSPYTNSDQSDSNTLGNGFFDLTIGPVR
jgi:hypothetical protein